MSLSSVLKTTRELGLYQNNDEVRNTFKKLQSLKNEINFFIEKLGGEILSGEYSMYSIPDYWAELDNDWRYKVPYIDMDSGATLQDIITPANELKRTLEIYTF